MKVFKYPLRGFHNEVRMPMFATFLKAGLQEDIVIWMLVDPELPEVTRTLRVIGTGRDIPEGCGYLDSVQMKVNGHELVWHIFEELP